MQKQNFFDLMEDVNIQNLRKFNEEQQWFTAITPTQRFNHTDATCYTTNNRKITIELKTRDETLEQFEKWGTVFIEPQKLAYMSAVMESGYCLNENCLYINFTSDGHCIVFVFNKIKNIEFKPNVKIWNKGKEKYEYESRFALDIGEALVYN